MLRLPACPRSPRRPGTVPGAVSFEPDPSPYLKFSRPEWAALRASTPMTLTEADVEEIRGINVALSMEEVEAIYLPLSRLLNLHVAATQQLAEVTATFVGALPVPIPYVIGSGGQRRRRQERRSPACLQRLLSPVARPSSGGSHHHRRLPAPERRARSSARSCTARASRRAYDQPRSLLDFMCDVKAGCRVRCRAPSTPTQAYDIMDGTYTVVRQPDIVDRRGPQRAPDPWRRTRIYVSDYFDFSRSSSTPTSRHRAVVRRAVPDPA
jgi:type I pantothenate kinase